MLEPDKLKADLERKEEEAIVAGSGADLSPLTTLRIDVVGTRGKRYKGEFQFKVPSLGDQIRIGQMKTIYLPTGAAADQNALLLVEQICYLEVTLQGNKPEWWKPFQLYDAAPVSALYREALTYERKFHGGDAVAQADSGDVAEGGGRSADIAPDVGSAIQPPSKRREVLVADHP